MSIESGVDMSGDISAAWHAIGSLRDQLHDHEKKLITHTHRIETVERQQDKSQQQYDELCAQLKSTEKNINGKLDILLEKKTREEGLKEKVDFLMDQHQKNEGAKGLAKWFPILIQTAVGIAALYAIIK